MKLKEVAEVVLIPLAIAGVGVWATMKATEIQKGSANEIARIQGEQVLGQHIEGKDVDLTEQFFILLDKPDKCSQRGRVDILLEMVSIDHAERINSQYLRECPPSKSPKNNEASAISAINKAARNQASKLIAALEGSARRAARTQLTELYSKRPAIVGEELARAISESYDNYRVTLGVLVVLGSVPGGWSTDAVLEKQIEKLQNSPFKTDSTFSTWLKSAKTNKRT